MCLAVVPISTFTRNEFLFPIVNYACVRLCGLICCYDSVILLSVIYSENIRYVQK